MSERSGPSSARLSRNAAIALIFIGCVPAALTWPDPGLFRLLMVSERGIVENLNFAVAVAAAGLAATIAIAARDRAQALLRATAALAAVVLVAWAGEEISWGQHWFGWATPEAYAARNTQGETNLHNLSRDAERLPKLALTIGVYLGGVFWLIYASLRRRAPLLGGAIGWVWPDARLWHAAALALVVRLIERASTIEGVRTEDGVPFVYFLREYQELFMALYVLVYFIDVRRRLRAHGAMRSQQPA